MTSHLKGRLIASPQKLALAALLPLAAVPLTFAFDAIAATDTATLSVTASVQSGCSVNGGTLDFGNYQSGQAENLDVTGTISYTNCSGALTFELDGGQSGNVNARAMSSGGASLSYQLYRSSLRNSVFGEGNNAQPLTLNQVLSSTIEIHGRIPGNQSVAPGSYSDTVNITLTF